MTRRILVAVLVSIALAVTLSVPRFGTVGAWGRGGSVDGAQQTEANNVGRILGAPFRAIGKLFGGGKKKPVSKITDKDIKKFESFQVKRIKDAQTPPVAPAQKVAPAENSAVANGAAETVLVDHIQRGREFLNAGQLNEAIAELSLAVSADPKSGEAHGLLGVAYDRKGLGALARQSFEIAIQAPENRAVNLNNLGFLLYRQGEFEDAIKYLKKAVTASPSDARIWNNLTTAQLAAEKFDDAYKSSVAVIGEFASHVKIAGRLEWRGRTKDAIKHLEKARSLQPTSAEVLTQLATLYAGTGQEEKAEKARQSLTVATAPAQK